MAYPKNTAQSQSDVHRRRLSHCLSHCAGSECRSAAGDPQHGPDVGGPAGLWMQTRAAAAMSALKLGKAVRSKGVMMSRARVYADVNVTRPKDYWDYETLSIQWGWGACTPG